MGKPFTFSLNISFELTSWKTERLVKLILFTKGLIFAQPPWSTEMAKTFNVEPLNLFCSRSKEGISFIQGAHQVAQKFTRIIFPR